MSPLEMMFLRQKQGLNGMAAGTCMALLAIFCANFSKSELNMKLVMYSGIFTYRH